MLDDEVGGPLCPVEAEMAALGSMIASGEANEALQKMLEPADFFREAHSVIFQALGKIKGRPDRVLLLERLIRSRKLPAVGGEGYVDSLIAYMPVAGNYLHYAEIVKDRAVRRFRIAESQRTAAEMLDLDKPVLNGQWSRHQVLGTQTFGDDYEPPVVRHLIPPYLVCGKAVLWDADGGTHKTGCLMAISAWLSRGMNPLTGEECEPVRTLYLHKGEDQSDELEAIYRANGGVRGMIEYVERQDLVLDDKGIELIGNTLVDRKSGFMVLDAFFYFLPSTVRSTNENLPAMAVMQPYNAMLASTGVSAVDMRHTTKLTVDKEASNRGMGSVQFRNSHRGQLAARYDPTDESESKRVIVTDEKGSLLNPRGKPFAFRRVGLEIQFVRGDVENPFISPEKEMYSKRDRGTRPAPKFEQCKVWLIKTIGSDAHRRDAIIQRGIDAGFKERMLDDARAELEFSTAREPKTDGSRGGGFSWWARPEFDWSTLEAEWTPQPKLEEYDPYTDQ